MGGVGLVKYLVILNVLDKVIKKLILDYLVEKNLYWFFLEKIFFDMCFSKERCLLRIKYGWCIYCRFDFFVLNIIVICIEWNINKWNCLIVIISKIIW